jgi:dTDP-4-dehydrorhamnose reductase
MKHILVTGANGQLGQCFQQLSKTANFKFTFLDSKQLDVTSIESINSALGSDYDFCINCAAYTAVDKAESEKEIADKINHLAVKNIAKACLKHGITLIHISTDFVFNGKHYLPYKESDKTEALSVYGQTKLEGELAIQSILENYFIIRTSWLYSEFGGNFVKSMLNLAKTRSEFSIVNNQIGTPTYAMDLAEVILKIAQQNTNFGLYHYSNQGVASWYDFSKVIFEKSKTNIKVNPIPASSYPTPAKRPHFSVLDKEKIATNFSVEIPYWQESLDRCLKALL